MARIGGAFPFPITDLLNGGGMITLGSGGLFYPPAGEYVISLGGVTNLQTFDPVQGQWRELGEPAIDSTPFTCDGYNWRVINLSGTVAGALVTNAGSGATNGIGTTATGVSIAFAAPPAPGATATAYPIVGGAVVAPTIQNAGTGFLVPPLVVIDPPPFGGIQAQAIATLTAIGGGIASITMVQPGAGYTAIPNFYLIPQFGSYPGASVAGVAAGLIPAVGQVNVVNALPGTGLTSFTGASGTLLNAATLTGSGTLTGIGMINNGSFYTGTTIPAVAITGCGAAAATALPILIVTGATALVAGAGYGTGAPPNWESSLGVIAGSINNYDLSQRPATGTTTIVGGAIATVIIEDAGFGMQRVPTIAMANTSAIATVQGTFTPTLGSTTDTVLLQAKVPG